MALYLTGTPLRRVLTASGTPGGYLGGVSPMEISCVDLHDVIYIGISELLGLPLHGHSDLTAELASINQIQF